MKPDKLRNLLQEMDTRVGRMQAARNDHFVANLSGLRAQVQRLLGKVDSLQTTDIAGLEIALSAVPISELDRSSLNNLLLGLRIGLNQLGPNEVLDVTPGQKLAAFTFGFEGDTIKAVDQPVRTYGREADIAVSALEAAVEHGEYVNQDLVATNASPRLKEAFQRLQLTMLSHNNIVQIGARAQICNRLVHGDLEELSPTLFGLLIGHIESVFSALAQFEDWRIYSENAASLNVDAGSVAKLVEGTAELARKLEHDRLADKSVINALETVQGWVEEVQPPDKRDVLSLARSHENLWSIATKALLGDVISDGRKRLASGLVTALLLIAPLIVPVIGRVPGAQWIETVYDYFKAAGSKPPGTQ